MNYRRRVDQFTSCKGVFQGGGVKGLAYVGAYKAAVEAGVNFTEVCGTSAGSIFAAFIAAGATPEQLQNIVDRMDVDALFHIPWYSKGWLKYLVGASCGHIINPTNLEKILNTELCAILGIEGIVTFRHLRKPLTVITSDLCLHTYKVFSLEKTPNVSVAHAVVCSSAFTFFFKIQDKCYTDGGIVSNLPAFAIRSKGHFDKILAFNLLSKKTEKINPFCSISIIKNIVTTITNANVDVQSSLVPKCYIVPIDVKEYSALEFKILKDKNRLKELIDKGENSAKAFFTEKRLPANEQSQIIDTLKKSVEMRTQISLISLNEQQDIKEIYVISHYTIWARELFPLLVGWHQQNIRVEIFCQTVQGTKKQGEDARRRMLRHFGCIINEVSGQLPFTGYVVKRKNDYWEAIISDKNSDKGKYYHHKLDKTLITFTLKGIRTTAQHLGMNVLQPILPLNMPLQLQAVAESTIIQNIQNEPIYHNAILTYETVNLTDVIFLTQYVLNYKYINIDLIYHLYEDAGLEPFSAATFIIDNKYSLVGPPVLEEWNGKLYVIEGNTRCFYSRRNGLQSIKAIVARNVTTQLPSRDEYKFEEIIITDSPMGFEKRYRRAQDQNFRHIEYNLRPYPSYLV